MNKDKEKKGERFIARVKKATDLIPVTEYGEAKQIEGKLSDLDHELRFQHMDNLNRSFSNSKAVDRNKESVKTMLQQGNDMGVVYATQVQNHRAAGVLNWRARGRKLQTTVDQNEFRVNLLKKVYDKPREKSLQGSLSSNGFDATKTQPILKSRSQGKFNIFNEEGINERGENIMLQTDYSNNIKKMMD